MSIETGYLCNACPGREIQPPIGDGGDNELRLFAAARQGGEELFILDAAVHAERAKQLADLSEQLIRDGNDPDRGARILDAATACADRLVFGQCEQRCADRRAADQQLQSQ